MSNSPRAKARRTARSHLTKYQRGLLASSHRLPMVHSSGGFLSRLRGKFRRLWDFIKMPSDRFRKTKRVQLQIEKSNYVRGKAMSVKAKQNIKHDPATVVPQKR